MNQPMQQQMPGMGLLEQYGYKPIWERRPDLFPNGRPMLGQQQQQQSGSGNSQLLGQVGSIGGMAAGKYLGAQAGSLIGGGSAASGGGAAVGTAAAGSGAAGAGAGGGVTVSGSLGGGSAGGATGASAAGLGAGAAGAALMAANMYNYGGRNVLGGSADSGDWIDTAMGTNIATGWINPVLDIAGLDSVGGYYGKLAGSGKDERQQKRDSIRGFLKKRGILDDNYQAFGVDLGKDGGFRFDDGSRIYEAYAGQEGGKGEIDEQTAQLIGALNPLGYMLGQDDADAQGYTVGMLTNALKRGEGDQQSNLKSLYDKAGGYGSIFSQLGDAANSGKLSMDDARSYQNALNSIYGEEERNKSLQDYRNATQQSSQSSSPIVDMMTPDGSFNPWSYFGMTSAPDFTSIGARPAVTK